MAVDVLFGTAIALYFLPCIKNHPVYCNQIMIDSSCCDTIATPLVYLRPPGAIAVGAIKIEAFFFLKV